MSVILTRSNCIKCIYESRIPSYHIKIPLYCPAIDSRTLIAIAETQSRRVYYWSEGASKANRVGSQAFNGQSVQFINKIVIFYTKQKIKINNIYIFLVRK